MSRFDEEPDGDAHGECAAEITRLRAEVNALRAERDALQEAVAMQAADDGLWFRAISAPEAYLQQELTKLHRLIGASLQEPKP